MNDLVGDFSQHRKDRFLLRETLGAADAHMQWGITVLQIQRHNELDEIGGAFLEDAAFVVRSNFVNLESVTLFLARLIETVQ